MSTIHIPRVSASHPERFQAKCEDSARFLKPGASLPVDNSKPVITSQSQVSIIGAGFGGLASAVMLKKKIKTDDFVVFEKHSEWGGTWWANTYPGCASDIPALWYLLHGELNDNWSDLRPPQAEMEEYILGVVNKYNLKKNTRFGTAIRDLEYNEHTGLWKLSATDVASGQRYEHLTKVIFSCQGGLVYPNESKFPGLKDQFEGVYMHSALWDHSVDFTNKNVVVIGNGCSAAQVVPALLDMKTKSVTQVFRSKHWIMPPLPEFLYTMYKALSYTRLGLLIIRWFIILAAETRYPLYVGDGLLLRAVRGFNRWLAIRYIRTTAPKEYQEMLIPDFKIGCKRLIFDYKYVPSLNNPKFDLSDQRIDQVTAHHVVLADGTRIPADIIVACTGYNVLQSTRGFTVHGRNGTNLQEYWAKHGVSAYKTVMAKDCPNLFFIGGPNSATGHFSVVSAIENGVAFASKLLPDILDGSVKSITVKDSVYLDWFKNAQARLKKAVFGSEFGGCVSWYTTDGINAVAYPYSQLYYWLSLRIFSKKNFDIVRAEKKSS